MKTSNIQQGRAHPEAIIRGWVSSRRAGSSGVTVEDGTTTVGGVTHILIGGGTITDVGNGTIAITVGAEGDLGWFNVRDYGAVADGTTNDRTAINDAIADLNTAGAGVLYFPASPSAYLVSGGALTTITVPCLILGDGTESATATTNSGPVSHIEHASTTANLFTVNASPWAMSNLSMTQTAGTATAGAGISTDGGTGMTLHRVAVQNFYDCITIENSNLWNADAIYVAGAYRYGIRVRNTANPDAGDWSLVNCVISNANTADAALRVESSGGGRISNLKISSANSTTGYNHGIHVALATGVVTSVLLISNVSIEHPRTDGIRIETAGTGSYDLIGIDNCQFGLYSNTTGNAITINAATAGNIGQVTLSNLLCRASGGSSQTAIDLTNVDDVRVTQIIADGFGSRLATTTCTNVVDASIPPGTQFAAATFTSGVSITATTEATANTIVTASAYTFDGATGVYVEFYAFSARPDTGAAGRTLNLWLYDGSSSIGRIATFGDPAAAADNKPVLVRYFLTPSAASHTYSIRGSVSAGTGNVGAGAGGNGNDMPGYIRVFKH